MKRLVVAALALLCSACASYTTPAAGVSIAAISARDTDIAEAYSREAASPFPARMAVARVAAPGYVSRTNEGYGAGAFSVITTRDIEQQDTIEQLSRMPSVIAIAPLTRILLPAHLTSTRDLRQAAAQLKADVLLIYTLDTSFRKESMQLGPLQTVALGMLSSEKSIVTATCSFAIVDVRTGYIYGTGETSSTEHNRSNIWGTADAIDKARQRAESKAFADGVLEVTKLWASVVRENQGPK